MQIPVGYGLVSHVHRQNGMDQESVCTYGVRLDSVDFGENMVEDLHLAWATNITVLQTSTTALIRTTLKFGPVTTGPMFEGGDITNGSNGDPGLAPQVAYLARKRTALGGRENRGRMFIPGGAETQVSASGIIASATATGWQAGLDAFLAALAALDLPMVILHASASAPTDVSRLELDEVVATQRRRLR